MIGPFPKDPVINNDRRLSRTWDVWMNKLQNNVDFGKASSVLTHVTAAKGIQITNEQMRVISATAGDVTITSNPQITPRDDGSYLRVEGNDNVKTVTLQDGNGLSLTGGTNMVLGNSDVIAFHYNKTKTLWVEDYRSNK